MYKIIIIINYFFQWNISCVSILWHGQFYIYFIYTHETDRGMRKSDSYEISSCHDSDEGVLVIESISVGLLKVISNTIEYPSCYYHKSFFH